MKRNLPHRAALAAAFIAAAAGGGTSYGGTDRKFSILFVGDILLANEAERHIHKKGLEYPFWKIKQELLKYDFIFANMESPITKRGVPVIDKPYVFRVKPEDAVCLERPQDRRGFHSKQPPDGLQRPKAWRTPSIPWTALNIRHTGGGRNLAEARRPAILTYGETNIIILAYCNRPPEDYYATNSSPGIAPLDLAMIREDIDSYKLPNNIVLVSLHWGIEQTHEPQSSQVAEAHAIIDAGADAIIGHHPHWPQGIELYRGKPIIYSLGNFINGYINPVERDNIAVGFYYNGNTLEMIKVVPLAGRNRQIRFQPHVLQGRQATNFLKLIRNLSRSLKTDMEIINGIGLIDLAVTPGKGRDRQEKIRPLARRYRTSSPRNRCACQPLKLEVDKRTYAAVAAL